MCDSPIVVDVYDEGFHLTSAENGVRFDFGANGVMQQISWTDSAYSNAWLALDRNHNGRIDNAKELFGNITPQPPSASPNGYLALAVYDKPENGGNGDGFIDNRDAIYSKLLLWIDSNHDGVSQPQELHSLASMHVARLDLHFVEKKRRTNSETYLDTAQTYKTKKVTKVIVLPGTCFYKERGRNRL